MGVTSLPLVIDAVVKASVLLGATAIVALALRRASASARHLVWTLGLVGALAAPAVSMVTPHWTVPIVRIATVAQAAVAPSVAAPSLKHLAAGGDRDLPAKAGSYMTITSIDSGSQVAPA